MFVYLSFLSLVKSWWTVLWNHSSSGRIQILWTGIRSDIYSDRKADTQESCVSHFLVAAGKSQLCVT